MTIHTLKCGTVNCYAVQSDCGVILIDCGAPGDQKHLEKQLAELDIYMKDIHMVLLTHGHMDHIGTAGSFKGKYNIPIAMHPADLTLESMRSRGFTGKMLLQFSRKLLKLQVDFQVDITLNDGFSLKKYGLDASVIFLPGHSKGSVGILLENGDFICGDMYMNFIRPSLAHIFEDEIQLRESHEKLKRLNIKTVYPGHGKPFLFSVLS